MILRWRFCTLELSSVKANLFSGLPSGILYMYSEPFPGGSQEPCMTLSTSSRLLSSGRGPRVNDDHLQSASPSSIMARCRAPYRQHVAPPGDPVPDLAAVLGIIVAEALEWTRPCGWGSPRSEGRRRSSRCSRGGKQLATNLSLPFSSGPGTWG